jgi:hypothetical protein
MNNDNDKAQILGDFMIKVTGKESAWVVIWADGNETCLITNVVDRDNAVDWLRNQADLLERRNEKLHTTHMRHNH